MYSCAPLYATAAQAESVEEGIAMCKEAHAAGKGGDTLKAWVKLSQELRAQED